VIDDVVLVDKVAELYKTELAKSGSELNCGVKIHTSRKVEEAKGLIRAARVGN
jgi:hypothetical protein